MDADHASLNVLLRSSIPVGPFCHARKYHADTSRVASRPEMANVPLAQVSEMCFHAQRQAESLQQFHAAQLQLKPPVQTSQLPTTAGVFALPQPLQPSTTRVTSTPAMPAPAAPKAPPPAAATLASKAAAKRASLTITKVKKEPQASTSSAANVFHVSDSEEDVFDDTIPYDSHAESSDSVQIIEPDVGMVPLRDLQPPQPLCFDQSFDAPSLDHDATEDSPALREMFKFIGDTVQDVDAVPAPNARGASIRSALQATRSRQDILCLTTSNCSRQCVERRQQELKQSEARGQAKDYMRVTSSDVTCKNSGLHTW